MAAGPRNPIHVPPGQIQTNVNPALLRPSRRDLIQSRLDLQLQLNSVGIQRRTPISVSTDGVIIDGHHAVRVAYELGVLVDVEVTELTAAVTADSISLLRIRNR